MPLLGFELSPARSEVSRAVVYTRWSAEAFRRLGGEFRSPRPRPGLAPNSSGTVAHGSSLMEFEVVQKVEAAARQE